MKKLIVIFLLGAGLGYTQGSVPETIELSIEDKHTLMKADNEVLYLRVNLQELEKAYVKAQTQLVEKQRNLQETLDKVMLQYIKEEDRSKYRINQDLNLERIPDEQ